MYLKQYGPYNIWKFQSMFLLIIIRFVAPKHKIKPIVSGLETDQTWYIKVVYANSFHYEFVARTLTLYKHFYHVLG